jgi:glycosyltransferase involved in cell wall biosynthesis
MNVGLLTGWMSNRGGGVLDAVHRLAMSLQTDPELRVAVFGLADRRMPMDERGWADASPVALQTRGPEALGYAPELPAALASGNLDLLHVHGLWMHYTYASLGWARATGRPYMISPHGMLDSWALRNSHWKKQLALWLYEERHLRGATCLHALCEAEAEAIRAIGLDNPICVIPNGLDKPESAPPGRPGWGDHVPEDARVLLYLGRLHPKKGLINLLHAWADFIHRAGRKGGNWYLAIAGWDQVGHEGELRRLTEQLELTESVAFIGPMFRADKARCFSSAEGFVLPSVSEGLPMVVLEAWSYGRPVLMTRHCNLPEGFRAGAALEIGTDPAAIHRGLDLFARMSDDQRQAMGGNGRRLCRERFSQERTGDTMREVYRWMLRGGSRPECVLGEAKELDGATRRTQQVAYAAARATAIQCG